MIFGVEVLGTHREDVHGCAHDDLEELWLVRLGRIAACETHREAESMSDVDRALPASARRVEHAAIGREV